AGTNGTNIDMGKLSLEAVNGSIADLDINERIWEDKMIANILGEDKADAATMPAEGNTFSIKKNPVTGKYEMTVNVGYAQIKFKNDEEATEVDAKAKGDADITEVSGDAGIKTIESTNGDITLTVADTESGNLINKNDSQDTPVIVAANAGNDGHGNVTINVPAGEVGEDGTGENEKRIVVNAGGTVKVTDKDDIYVDSDENLTIITNSAEGKTYIRGEKDVNASNVSGDYALEVLTAGGNGTVTAAGTLNTEDIEIGGNAVVTAGGDVNVNNMEAGGDSTITANDGVDINNLEVGKDSSTTAKNGDIDVDTLKVVGTLSMDASEDITVDKTVGDLTVDTIKAGNDVDIRIDDSIKDNKPDTVKDLMDAAQEVVEAEKKIEELQKEIDDSNKVITNITNAQTELNNRNEVTDAQLQVAKTKAADDTLTKEDKKQAEKELKELEDKFEALKKDIADKAVADDIKKQIENATTIAEIGQILNDSLTAEQTKNNDLTNELGTPANGTTPATGAYQKLENAKTDLSNKTNAAGSTTAITAGGDVKLTGDDGAKIGDGDNNNSLSIDAGGKVTLQTESGSSLGDVDIESNGDLNLGNIKSNGDVRVDANGDITNAGDNNKPLIDAGNNKAEINATGTVGTKDTPIDIIAGELEAIGDEVALIVEGSTKIDSVIAVKDPQDTESGNVSINVKGDITAGNNNGDSNVIGSEVDINAGKNIGDDTNKLTVDADELNVNAGGNIDLITNGDTKVGRITAGGDIDIEAKGDITAKDNSSLISGRDVTIKADGKIGDSVNKLNIYSRGNVNLSARTEEPHVNVTIIRPSTNPETDDDSYDDDDSYIYPVFAKKQLVVIPERKIARNARPSLDDDIIDEVLTDDDDTQKPAVTADDDNKNKTDKPAVIDESIDEEHNNMILFIIIAVLLLLLIAAAVVIINNKKKNGMKTE
ncbi:MAG: hypothetical protein K6G69_08600, partial [Lachnospiraceae bacterium]|nr:hypothetical protein [Lachnospiraceae bacterium]